LPPDDSFVHGQPVALIESLAWSQDRTLTGRCISRAASSTRWRS